MTKTPTLESELPKRCYLARIDLPVWCWEVAESESRVLTKGNVDRLLSRYIATAFECQRRRVK